jgi:hypothetical protein
MRIYRVEFRDYSDDYYFAAKSLLDAKKEAEKWAKIRNKEDGESYGEIDSISFELETENLKEVDEKNGK